MTLGILLGHFETWRWLCYLGK